MGLKDDALAIIASWGDEADSLATQLDDWETAMPAFLFNWVTGFVNQRVNTLKECKEALETLIDEYE